MKTLVAAMVLGAVLAPGAVVAQGDLEERVKVLERKLEQQAEDKAVGDASFEFKLRGLLQTDGRFFADDAQAFNDTFLVRRLEPSFEFGLGKLAFFKLQPQFAGDGVTTSDVYGELRFHPAATLRFGKFKTPLALEYLQASAPLMFVERGLPTEVGAGRDIGLQLLGELFAGTTTYAISYGNGTADGRDAVASDVDNHKEAAARVFVEPFKNGPGFFRGLGFGIAATSGEKLGTVGNTSLASNAASFNATLPRYRSPGQNPIFAYRLETAAAANGVANTVIADGQHTRLSPQLYLYHGCFGVLAEHVRSEQDVSINGIHGRFEHAAWQVAASVLLTGEDASFKGVKPGTPYAVGAPGWGAFEIAVRHGELDIDDAVFPAFADPYTQVSEAATSGVALSWYVTGNVRVSLDYERTAFEGGAGTSPGPIVDRDDEKVLFTRLQLAF